MGTPLKINVFLLPISIGAKLHILPMQSRCFFVVLLFFVVCLLFLGGGGDFNRYHMLL